MKVKIRQATTTTTTIRKGLFARVSPMKTAKLSSEFGFDYAVKIFGEAVRDFPKSYKICWYKTETGGAMKGVGIVPPNKTFGHGIFKYGLQGDQCVCGASNMIEAKAHLEDMLFDKKRKYYKDKDKGSQVDAQSDVQSDVDYSSNPDYAYILIMVGIINGTKISQTIPFESLDRVNIYLNMYVQSLFTTEMFNQHLPIKCEGEFTLTMPGKEMRFELRSNR